MTLTPRLAAVLLALVPVLAAAREPSSSADAQAVHATIEHLLARYAANDADAVLDLVAPQFVMYGSDAAEKVDSDAALRTLMRDDFTLWRTASFGAMQDEDIRVFGDVAVAHFQVPFRAGGGPDVLVRFATTWVRDGGRWQLVQSANTVPTRGSSAAELVSGRR